MSIGRGDMKNQKRKSLPARIVLWLAWKIDRACHRIIERLDPLTDNDVEFLMQFLDIRDENDERRRNAAR